MNCPACNTKVKEVSTTSHYGIPIALDQCPNCGGIWFDDSEMHRTKRGEAMRIEKKIDVRSLRKFSEEVGNLRCPKDGAELKPLKGKHYFNNLEMDVCPKCGGLWLNYGVFSKFQKLRLKVSDKINARKKALKDLKNEDEISKRIAKQAIAVMTLNQMYEEKKERDRKMNLAQTIIMIILRLLFRR